MIPVGRRVLFKFKDKKIYKEGKVVAYPAEGIIHIEQGLFEAAPFIVKLEEIDLVERMDD